MGFALRLLKLFTEKNHQVGALPQVKIRDHCSGRPVNSLSRRFLLDKDIGFGVDYKKTIACVGPSHKLYQTIKRGLVPKLGSGQRPA